MGILTRKQVKAGGKVVLCDFRELKPGNFQILYGGYSHGDIKKSSILISDDAVLYINLKMPGMSKEAVLTITDIYAILAEEEKKSVDLLVKIYRKKYPEATLSNWTQEKDKLETDKEKTALLSALLAPMELDRRRLEEILSTK